MTNRIAFTLALIIIGIFLADHFLLHFGLPLYAGRQLAHAVEWVKFWR